MHLNTKSTLIIAAYLRVLFKCDLVEASEYETFIQSLVKGKIEKILEKANQIAGIT